MLCELDPLIRLIPFSLILQSHISIALMYRSLPPDATNANMKGSIIVVSRCRVRLLARPFIIIIFLKSCST
jgi:hypothetical protein